MKSNRPLIISGVAAAVLCLLGWMHFRPLMFGLGFWQRTAQSALLEQAGDTSLQRLNVVYFLLVNGFLTAAIFTASTLWGWFVVQRLVRLQPLEQSDDSAHSCQSASVDPWLLGLWAFGLGVLTLSLMTFLLGWAGCLYRGVFILLLAVLATPQLIILIRHSKQPSVPKPKTDSPCWPRHLWLLLVMAPLVTLTLLAAMLPSGVLWAHDGRGFDCLEYHLQLPREYFDAGRIQYVPHNAFAAFPANAEMLYLLAMVIKDDPLAGMYLGKMFNFALAAVFVAGIYLVLRRENPLAALLAAFLAAGPQLVFVATNAYVECYLLVMFLLAISITPVFLARFQPNLPLRWWSTALLAGLFSGAACGAKYTALLMVVPTVLLFLWPLSKPKWATYALFLLAMLTAFSPWLIRNQRYYGNPVFPLAPKILGQADWSDQQLQRWERAVTPTPDMAPWPARLRALTRHITTPRHYGAIILSVVLLIALTLAKRKPWPLLPWLALISVLLQLLLWLTMTHIQSRFLLTTLVPLAVLIVLLTGTKTVTLKPLAVFLVLWTCGWTIAHTAVTAGAYNKSTTTFAGKQGFLPLVGRDDFLADIYPFAGDFQETVPATHVLLVGESRPFYTQSRYTYNTVFNRCFLDEQFAQNRSPARIIQWLQQFDITHVYVNWDETARLGRSYGFGPNITPKNLQLLIDAGLREVVPETTSALPKITQLFVVPLPLKIAADEYRLKKLVLTIAEPGFSVYNGINNVISYA